MATEDSKKNDDMTVKEREQWLRDHGVLIETAEDRRRPQANSSEGVRSIGEQLSELDLAVAAQQPANNNDNEEVADIKFVCVPHDDSKPVRTVTLPSSLASKSGDSLPKYIQPYFGDSKSIDASLLEEQATKHFVGGDLEGQLATNVSAAAMNAAAAQGSVETFSLVHPGDTNHFMGVYIYLDEVGLLKKLPNNRRASQMAAACGFHPAPNFYGDVFIGRVQTKPIMANVDFVAGVDTSAEAEWMRRAVSENLAWQQELNKVTGRTGETQPAHAGTDGNVASEDTFTWTQDDDEVEFTVPFDSSIHKASVKVTFLSRMVKVKYAGDERVSVKLYGGIDVDGCTWTIDGNNLVITCEKASSGEIWPRVQ